jgi:hypothetical protein
MRSIATPILLFLEGYISAFWDHNLEITIGFQGLGQLGSKHEVELGMGPAQNTVTPGTSKPVCPGPTLKPAMYDWQLWMFMDCLSYGRRYLCALGPASLCTHAPVCFPSSLCGGKVTACV